MTTSLLSATSRKLSSLRKSHRHKQFSGRDGGTSGSLTRCSEALKTGRMTEFAASSDALQTRMTLLAKVRNSGNRAAWEEFAALYRPLLVGYVASRGLRDEDVQDLVQEILIKLMRLLPEFSLDTQRGRFRTWLYRVSTSTVIDWARRRKRQARRNDELEQYYQRAEAAAETASVEEFAKEHQRRVLAFVIERLRAESNPQTWQCFEQTALKGRPAAEVAAQLDLNINNVYVNTSRVLTKIRERCAEYMESIHEDGSALSA